MRAGDQVITLVDLDQPQCVEVYGNGVGTSPPIGCQAALGVTGSAKCHNTRVTCQDSTHYNPDTLTLRFCRKQEGLTQYDPLIPVLESVDTTPAAINLAAMSKSASGFGEREKVVLTMSDVLHSDLLMDKYRLERMSGEAQGLKALRFSGAGQRADIAGPVGVTQTVGQKNTVEFWFNWDGTIDPDGASVFYVNTGGGNTWWIGVTSSAFGNMLGIGTFNADIYGVPHTGYSNKRVHLVAVFENNGTAGKKLYLNGTLAPSTLFGTPVDRISQTAIRLGTDFGGTPYDYSGVIDNLRVYNRELSAAEVALHYRGKFPEDNAVGIWLFDEAPGATFNDSTAFGHNGTLTGAVTRVAALAGGYDPYDRGTLWGKWIARNPYHSGYRVRIYEGTVGQAVEDMRVRHYLLNRINGPTNGQVKITCKDLFSKVEARKAVAPLASRGELQADITAVAGTLTLNPAGIGDEDYPTSGFVAIGDECIAFTRSGDVFTLTQRGALNTEADSHNTQDLVQLVLSFTAMKPHLIAAQLLTDYAGLVEGVDFILDDWNAKAIDIIDVYTARITEPTPVADLIGELEQQAGFTLWPDVTDGLIKFSALRAAATALTVTDNEWIVRDSLKLKRQDANRITQVWVHYGQIKPNVSLTDRRNYYSNLIEEDLAAEDTTQYDGISIREVFSRWVPQFGRNAAQRAGQRLLAMFRDAPVEAEFTLYASRAGQVNFNSFFNLSVDEIQDAFGNNEPVLMAPTMIENGEDFINVRCQEVTFPAAPPPGGTEILVYIENDTYNLNLRTIYDSLFVPLTGTEVVRFIISESVKVGSTSTATPAIRTGSWPAGVSLRMTVIGRIEGKAGVGGQGGGYAEGLPGLAGGAGGHALQAEYAINIDNNLGEIWGGAGGGGGGGGFFEPSTGLYVGGGGGGGGAGFDAGDGGATGTTFNFNPSFPPNPSPGSAGTTEAGGAGGPGWQSGAPISYWSGNGGAGGGPGLAGDAGTASLSTFSGTTFPGGSGGGAGNYVVGNSFVTWAAVGDRRGGVS